MSLGGEFFKKNLKNTNLLKLIETTSGIIYFFNASGEKVWTQADDQLETPSIISKTLDKILKRELDVPHSQIFPLDENIYYAIFNRSLIENSEEFYSVLLLPIAKSKDENSLLVKTIAHDLNNIFTSILHNTDLLKLKYEQDSKADQLIKNIENNSFRAVEILDGALRSEKGDKKIIRKIHIDVLFKDIKNTLRHTAPPNVKIDYFTKPDLKPINGNYSDIFRVLLNLAINACEAMKNGGKLQLHAGELDDENIFIEVIDSGEGITPENISRIFEPEFSTRDKGKISGIGLHIVKELVNNHDGSISVESKINEGTTFKIILPSVRKRKSMENKFPTKTILIAEDNLAILEELSELLRYENYKTVTASDGDELLSIYEKRNDIDLFVIDKKMPGVDGLECIKKIREKDKEVPILLATGSIPELTEKESEELKIDSFLKKPYSFDKLIKTVNALI
ncbi:MAG: response regulator [Chlorobi bacterium]|nr:response regulator [Chlorobiota bacterium]